MACTHTDGRWVSGGVDDWTGEDLPAEWVEYSTTEDIDTHRYRCTLCKKVMYYSGAARDYHEKGIKSHVDGLGG
jgi:hypothetical protein